MQFFEASFENSVFTSYKEYKGLFSRMSSGCEEIRSPMTFNYSCNSTVNNFSVINRGQHEAQNIEGEEHGIYSTASQSCSKPVISVARRNERERKRVRLVNQGFAILRSKVPRDKCSRGRRSSKVETLRAAILYIRELQQLLLESQTRFQNPEMMHCYSYATENTFFNAAMTSSNDSYVFNNGFSQDIQPLYQQYRENADAQYASEKYDHRLTVPWFS